MGDVDMEDKRKPFFTFYAIQTGLEQLDGWMYTQFISFSRYPAVWRKRYLQKIFSSTRFLAIIIHDLYILVGLILISCGYD